MPLSFGARARELVQASLAFLYPEVCQVCREQRAVPPAGYVCAACWQGVRFLRPPLCERCGLPYEGEIEGPFVCANCDGVELAFTRARSAVAARGVVLEIIHRYKYGRELFFEPFLADLLAREAAPVLARECWDALVPVPLHPLREREREFNQALRLARCLSRVTGIPVWPDVVRRIRPTRTQTQLSRSERAENVRHAFDCEADAAPVGQRLVLVDDVMTTGATTSACARALRAAGAAEVCVWTVARGLIH
ncbi:MAG TPA: ComF family protein [Methylomirabilota bacterium]|nr:ComF family protein [Methylomirabilota bacterium]